MELITSKELLPRLISAHEQDASFISLHLQDKSLLCWHTKATHTQAIPCLEKKLAAGYLHEINKAEHLIWWIRCDIIFNFVDCFQWNGSHRKSLYNLHGKAVLQCTLQQSCVCKCACASKKNGFFSIAQFHLERLSLSSSGNTDQMDERCFLLFSIRRGRRLLRIFYLLSCNRTELCPSMQYHLSLFSLSSGYHIRLSISTHLPLRRQAFL